jgi:ABC-2 type transport system permease protein
MKGLYAALWAEILKVRRSKLLWISFLAFSLIGVIMGLTVLVSEYPQLAGQSAIVDAKASLFKAEWPSYFELLIEIILTLGTIGFGIVSSWIFGRDFLPVLDCSIRVWKGPE